MTENNEFLRNEGWSEGKYDSLKKNLLDGSVLPGDIWNEIFELDQSSPTRDAAERNREFLRDPEILEYLATHPEAKDGYCTILTLTEFHIGQRLAMGNSTEALSYFKDALKSAELDEADGPWTAYVRGTVLYMEGKEIPEEVIREAEPSGNDAILRNFNAGLKERGRPSYQEDYAKGR